MLRTVVTEVGGRRVIAMDSISSVEPEDRGHVVVSGSNGGIASGRVAADVGCAFVVTNDAGIGKDDAGIAGMRALDAHAIPAITAAHDSAAISDGLDTWEHGVVSYANETARRAGVATGRDIKEVVLEWLRTR